MNGSLVPLRTVIILGVILVGMFFMLGYFHWNSNAYKCFSGKHQYGGWVVVGSLGGFEIRAKPYGCAADDRYDPKQFKRLY